MSKKKKQKKEGSWKSLIHIYKTAKIPWMLLVLVVVCDLGMQTIGVKVVPYGSKIDTGTMGGMGFIAMYAILSIVYCMFENGYDLFNGMGRAKMCRNVRRTLWGKMLRLPISSYEKEEPQRFVSRITKDTEHSYSAITAIIQLVSIIYGCVLAMIEVIKIYADLSWIMLGVIPVLIFCSWLVGKLQYKMQTAIIQANSNVTNYYSERLPNITYIKTNNMESLEREKGREISELKYKADKKYWLLYTFNLPISTLAQYLSSVAVLILASAMVRGGKMEMAQVISLTGYFDLVMNNATMFITVWQAIKMSHGGTEKIAEIESSEEEQIDGSVTAEGQEDIVFDHVAFQYSNGKEVLKDLSCRIPRGKITAIVGENGSGKSTLMRLLERFDPPTEGKIYVGGQEITSINGKKWRDSLGYVFQGNQMIQGTVEENITYAMEKGYDREQMIRAAKDARAYDFIMEKEEEFQTKIDIFNPEFSGGQLQRLAIARVLMKDFEYLLLDEATSGIDTETEKAVLETIFEKSKGKTLVFIAHNMELIRKADHIIVIRDGSVEAEGTDEEVLAQSGTYQAFVQAG